MDQSTKGHLVLRGIWFAATSAALGGKSHHSVDRLNGHTADTGLQPVSK